MRLVQKSFVAKGLKTKEGCFSMASRTVKRLGEKLRSWRKRREGSYLPAFWIVAPSARDQDSLPNRGKYASCHLIGFLIGVGGARRTGLRFSSFLLDLSAEQRMHPLGRIFATLYLSYSSFSTCQNLSIEDGEFSLDANFVSRQFLGKIAGEMDIVWIDRAVLFFSILKSEKNRVKSLWWRNIYLERFGSILSISCQFHCRDA